MVGDWRQVLTGIRSRHQNLAPGEALFRDGDDTRSLYHVERGCLLLRHGGISLHRAKAGELIAENSLFLAHHDCDAIAEAATEVEIFPKATVLLHLSAHSEINLAFSAYLARQVQALRGRLEITRLKSAAERVVAYLTLMGADEGVIRLERPLVAVADEIGLTHEALYRALARLRRENRLERPGKGLFRLLQHLE